MIYIKPRKMMSVERMRKQREKHHPTRYMVWYFDRRTMVDLEPDVWTWVVDELKEQFMIDVRRWNFSRKAELGPVTMFEDYDIDFDRVKIVFEVRRLPLNRDWVKVMERMAAQHILTPNEIRVAFGLEPW